MVVGIFGPSVAFTGNITKQAFASLATTHDREISGYQYLRTLLCEHVRHWRMRGPEPTYSVRHPMIAEAGPRKPVIPIRKAKRGLRHEGGKDHPTVRARGIAENVRGGEITRARRAHDSEDMLVVPKTATPNPSSTPD